MVYMNADQRTSLRQKTNSTRGLSETGAYSAWANMHAYCTNSSHHSYSHFGGRGISICDRWYEFATFYAGVGDRSADYTLARLDESGDFTRENCRWLAKKSRPCRIAIQGDLTASSCPDPNPHHPHGWSQGRAKRYCSGVAS